MKIENAVKGDIAVFRNGGKSVISKVDRSTQCDGYYVRFVGVSQKYGIHVKNNGKLFSSFTNAPVAMCPFDIVNILSKKK